MRYRAMTTRMFGSIMVIFAILCLFPNTAWGASGAFQERYMHIATIDTRPISSDRLLYTAFKDIGYQASFTTDPMYVGYMDANSGKKDGVIASTPDIEELYDHLVKVPVALETTYLYALTREDSDLKINEWSDLSGLSVCINNQRTYVTELIPDDAKVTEYDTTALILEGLVNKKHDVAILSKRSYETINLPGNVVYSGQLAQLSDYLYLNENNRYMVPIIANALRNIFNDGRADKILRDIPINGDHQKRTILHIVSSNTQMIREEQFSAKLRERFGDDLSTELYTIELNSRRFSTTSDRLAYFADLIRQDYVSRDTAAVIVSGETALSFLAEHYYLFFRNVPVVFYGVGQQYETIIKGYEPFFTGIVEELSVYETVENALRFFPHTKNLFVVNDYMAEGIAYRAEIANQLRPMGGKLNIEYNEDVTNSQLFERIRGLSDDTMVLFGSYFSDNNGQYFSLKETSRHIERDCGVPVISFYSTGAVYGALGGKSVDYEKYGDIVSELLGEILKDNSIAKVPVITESKRYNRWVFDKNVMDKYGIPANELPLGSEVLNKIPSIWESDPRFATVLVLLVVISIAVVIGISVIYVKYKKRKELLLRDKKIKEVKERLECIISTTPVCYAACVDGVVVEINEYMRHETGIDVGGKICDIYANPEDRFNLVERVMKEGFIKNEVVRYVLRDGQIHRCILNMTKADFEGQLAIVAWIIDIEQDEVKKEQLLTARQSLQTIFDTMPAPIGITDIESMEIVYGNDACIRLFEFDSIEELRGIRAEKLYAPSQNDGVDAATIRESVINSQETVIAEIKALTSKEREFDARILSRRIDYNGKKAYVSIITDLAQEKEYQRMLFNTAEKEREANLLKSRFLVNMSHEIRTPMNAIIGLSEIEIHKKRQGDVKDVFKKINISARNLLNIVNDILDLSKIEADKIELYEEEFELEDVLNSALLVASPRLDGKNVEFLLNASLKLPRYLVGDKTRIWQILKNFLDNSAKYTDKGKIVLTVFADEAGSSNDVVNIVFIIEDSGIGMSEAQLQKLFMPYEQVYNEAQKKYSGTGLGMPISKQLCEIMGGTLNVSSRLNVGTTIRVSIPFKRSEKRDTEMQSLIGAQLSGIKALAVDDDPLSLDIVVKLLESSGVSCTRASNGAEALDIIVKHKKEDRAFDVIMLDYLMEDLNGLETAGRIHMALSKSPKLLMVTAYQKLLLRSELKKYGIDDIIEKPFIPSQFIAKVCAVLGNENYEYGERLDVIEKYNDVHVLLCEDYYINQEVATGMFEQFGITASIAENGKEGIDLLNSGKRFDLIFMDLQMPVMDGYTTAQAIRKDSRFDDIPIISLTADAMKEVINKCIEMGMDDYVSKPIEFDSLKRVFNRWLPESKRDAGTVPQYHGAEEGLARFGGNRERYENALSEFSKMLRNEWLSFESAVSDNEGARSFLHKLKGAAGNLGLKDIYESAVDYEKSLRGGQPDEELYRRLEESCGYIMTAPANNNGVEPDSEVGTAEELTRLLDSLREALLDYSPNLSLSVVKLIKEKAWPFSDNAKLTRLCEMAQEYEFDEALDILDSIAVPL